MQFRACLDGVISVRSPASHVSLALPGQPGIVLGLSLN